MVVKFRSPMEVKISILFGIDSFSNQTLQQKRKCDERSVVSFFLVVFQMISHFLSDIFVFWKFSSSSSFSFSFSFGNLSLHFFVLGVICLVFFISFCECTLTIPKYNITVPIVLLDFQGQFLLWCLFDFPFTDTLFYSQWLATTFLCQEHQM
jgi:hypothetical protein